VKVVLLLLFSFVAIAFATVRLDITEEDKKTSVLEDGLIERINTGDFPWVAKRNTRFEGWSVADAKRIMGTLKNQSQPIIHQQTSLRSLSSVPDSFDSRIQWPGCIHRVLDQGKCGSCWAFGATESLSDRFCIASQSKINVELSPQSLVSCDWEGNFGCDGGIPQLAWEYMEYAGVLTLSCFPYTSGSGHTPKCPSKCNGTSPFEKYYAKKLSQHTYITAHEIQNAIYSYGPVEGTMNVYSDFTAYSSGVYVKTSGSKFLGGHAIKIIGWGHDDKSNLDYWIVQNSWGVNWGLNGYFWIRRGTDECGIDRDASAGSPSLSV